MEDFKYMTPIPKALEIISKTYDIVHSVNFA